MVLDTTFQKGHWPLKHLQVWHARMEGRHETGSCVTGSRDRGFNLRRRAGGHTGKSVASREPEQKLKEAGSGSVALGGRVCLRSVAVPGTGGGFRGDRTAPWWECEGSYPGLWVGLADLRLLVSHGPPFTLRFLCMVGRAPVWRQTEGRQEVYKTAPCVPQPWTPAVAQALGPQPPSSYQCRRRRPQPALSHGHKSR